LLAASEEKAERPARPGRKASRIHQEDIMASVFKPTGRRIYKMKFKDQHGNLQTASTKMIDRRAAEGLASMVERDAERIRAGREPENLKLTGEYLGLERPVGSQTWEEAVAAYLNELTRQGSGPGTAHHRDSGTLLAKIGRECRWPYLSTIQPSAFIAFLGKLAAAGRAPRTQNRYHETLRAACNFWVLQGWLTKSPLDQIKPVKVGQAGRRRLRRPYTWDEFQRLLAVARRKTQVCYTVAAYSGFRRGELRRLTREDCTPVGPHPRWHVDAKRTKNGQPVRLPMVPECAEALAEHWRTLPPGGKLIAVPTKETFWDHLRRAGIARQDDRGRWADFHSLRYTFCLWASKLFPIEVVSKLMRHGSLNLTTQIYLDLGLDREGEGAWVLPRLSPAAPARAQEISAQPGDAA
jgi:integrase